MDISTTLSEGDQNDWVNKVKKCVFDEAIIVTNYHIQSISNNLTVSDCYFILNKFYQEHKEQLSTAWVIHGEMTNVPTETEILEQMGQMGLASQTAPNMPSNSFVSIIAEESKVEDQTRKLAKVMGKYIYSVQKKGAALLNPTANMHRDNYAQICQIEDPNDIKKMKVVKEEMKSTAEEVKEATTGEFVKEESNPEEVTEEIPSTAKHFTRLESDTEEDKETIKKDIVEKPITKKGVSSSKTSTQSTPKPTSKTSAKPSSHQPTISSFFAKK
uniref:DNA polymerase delta subunit 3 n=1 Tax=Rhabditophanes sp. KR3021 TaxID=114890 RepID=A0AC35TSU5_9BILA